LAYLGNRPAESFASFEKQVFTIVNSQTAYTLSHSVVNENDIRLVVNNVVQEPGSGKAYTASGTTLTLSAALTNGTDTMYCVFLGRALQTVNAPNASVGSDQTAPTIITGQTAETSIATDDTILIHDTSASALRKMTRANFVSGIGGTNTPAFVAYKNTNQTISNDTYTKITFEAEQLDSDSTYDTSNSRFTPGVAGYYWIGAKWRYDTGTDFDSGRYAVYKNGSNISKAVFVNQNTNGMTFSIIVYSDADDYFEMYGRQNSGSSQVVNGNSTYPEQDQAQFYAFRIIGV
jgi:hypothetical protein